MVSYDEDCIKKLLFKSIKLLSVSHWILFIFYHTKLRENLKTHILCSNIKNMIDKYLICHVHFLFFVVTIIVYDRSVWIFNCKQRLKND